MRTTIISTSRLNTNKTIGYFVLAALLAIILYLAVNLIIRGSIIQGSTLPIVWIYVIFISFKLLRSLKNISYDESSIYYERDGYEVQIPFEVVKNIEIKTLTGIYTINLYGKGQDGDKISFRTSMWYPLNFKKKDEKVNELRDKIDRYKRTLPEKNFAGLSSYNI